MPGTSERTKHFSESVIRMMTRIALEHDAINLSQGFPDFEPPAALLEAAHAAVAGPYHQYAITWGARRFREALADKLRHFTGLPVDPEKNLVVTCGSTEAMLASLMSVVNPGDAVVIFSPFYENYGADAVLSGAVPRHVTLRAPDWAIDEAELARAMKGARAIVVCNPSNPSGKVFTRAELEFILRLAEENDAYVVLDEVYEHIVYAPHEHVYAATLPGAAERVITCGSLSKTYSITGWRLGYVMATPAVVDAVRKVHDFLTVGAAAPLQEAAVTALRFGDDYYQEFLASYTRKRELFLGYLDRLGFPYAPPQGAYYVMVDVSELGFASDVELCKRLARDVGVAAVPGSSFFHEPEHRFIRFHFAKKEETLRAAGERLLGLRDKLR